MRSTGYNPRKQMIVSRRVLALVLVVVWMRAALFRAEGQANREWPVAGLAKQIAASAGPGPAKLSIQNLSSLSADEIPRVRALLEHELKGYGVIATTADSPTSIRVTLSENSAGGLWVAEVQEGTEVRVMMAPAVLGATGEAQPGAGVTLRKVLVWQQRSSVLDVLIVQQGAMRTMFVLEPERVVSYAWVTTGWAKQQEFAIAHTRPFPRDMRGRLIAGQGHVFDAYLPGVLCTGTASGAGVAVSCSDSDDPWPLPDVPASLNVVQSFSAGSGSMPQKAFYNITHNYFTGVLSPGFGMQLQPFYDAAALSRPTGAAMLFNETGGRIVLIENSVMKPITGTRDWGSDFVAVHSACGTGTQVLVSGSGAAPSDSVRAYDIPGREAGAVSAPLAMDGPVMAMWPANDGAGATVVVRSAAGQIPYEVYSVSALCN
jgi:hypothetical protein